MSLIRGRLSQIDLSKELLVLSLINQKHVPFDKINFSQVMLLNRVRDSLGRLDSDEVTGESFLLLCHKEMRVHNLLFSLNHLDSRILLNHHKRQLQFSLSLF